MSDIVVPQASVISGDDGVTTLCYKTLAFVVKKARTSRCCTSPIHSDCAVRESKEGIQLLGPRRW